MIILLAPGIVESTCSRVVQSQSSLENILSQTREFLPLTKLDILGFLKPITQALDAITNRKPISPIRKFIQSGRGNVPEITIHVHDFVVAVHGEDIAATLEGLAFELLEEVEDFEFLAAAVEDVSDLDKGGGAAGPAVVGVDEAGKTEGLLGFEKVSMEVADGYEALGRREGGLEGRGRGVGRQE
ncbi:hypothetical protein E3N88_16655 [Mikania micrantha]|uniref:Uncharacterized protein n=1 Tax=Mikania micrantha TaxID=192012 RepID=A0A5N6P233_9ASTR|nr:hypothetical protein E3N88_16655 [Mikania micrantha]